jgi:hypothetical protein
MASERFLRGTRRGFVVALLVLVATTISACDDDGGVTVPPRVPLAYTRFVHALPDTGPTDWRFIDQIENSPLALGLRFRDFTPYQATTPGSRRLRVFPTSTNIGVTSKFLIDTLLTFENDLYYTIVHLGYAQTGQAPAHRILLLRDDVSTQDPSRVAVRLVHLGTGLGNIDVFADTVGGTSPCASRTPPRHHRFSRAQSRPPAIQRCPPRTSPQLEEVGSAAARFRRCCSRDP